MPNMAHVTVVVCYTVRQKSFAKLFWITVDCVPNLKHLFYLIETVLDLMLWRRVIAKCKLCKNLPKRW